MDGVQPHQIVEVYGRLLTQDLAEIDDRKTAMEKLIVEHLDRAKQLSAYEIRYDKLTRKLERSEELFDSILQRMRQIDITKDFGGFLTEEISPIETGYQIWPRKSFIAAFVCTAWPRYRLGAVSPRGLHRRILPCQR